MSETVFTRDGHPIPTNIPYEEHVIRDDHVITSFHSFTTLQHEVGIITFTKEAFETYKIDSHCSSPFCRGDHTPSKHTGCPFTRYIGFLLLSDSGKKLETEHVCHGHQAVHNRNIPLQ